MNTFYLPAKNLMAVLNCLPPKLSIGSPLLMIDLIEAKQSESKISVRLACQKKDYLIARNNLIKSSWFTDVYQNPNHCDYLLPNFACLRESLRRAGISPMSEESEQTLRELVKILLTPRKPLEGHIADHIYIGFDNNALRRRILQTHFFPLRDRSNAPSRWDLLMDPHCRSELQAIKGPDKLLPNLGRHDQAPPWLVDVYPNQPTVAGRQQALALRQIEKAIDPYRARQTPYIMDPVELEKTIRNVGRAGGKGTGGTLQDHHIARAHEAFGYRNQNAMIYFLTFDKNIANNFSAMNNVVCVVLKEPRDECNRSYLDCARWEQFGDLIYLLATLFGRVTLRAGENTLLHVDGMWTYGPNGGRDVEDDRRQLIRLIIPDNSSLEAKCQKKIQQHLKILEKIPDPWEERE